MGEQDGASTFDIDFSQFASGLGNMDQDLVASINTVTPTEFNYFTFDAHSGLGMPSDFDTSGMPRLSSQFLGGQDADLTLFSLPPLSPNMSPTMAILPAATMPQAESSEESNKPPDHAL
jgi:hypothetical protein